MYLVILFTYINVIYAKRQVYYDNKCHFQFHFIYMYEFDTICSLQNFISLIFYKYSDALPIFQDGGLQYVYLPIPSASASFSEFSQYEAGSFVASNLSNSNF